MCTWSHSTWLVSPFINLWVNEFFRVPLSWRVVARTKEHNYGGIMKLSMASHSQHRLDYPILSNCSYFYLITSIWCFCPITFVLLFDLCNFFHALYFFIVYGYKHQLKICLSWKVIEHECRGIEIWGWNTCNLNWSLINKVMSSKRSM